MTHICQYGIGRQGSLRIRIIYSAKAVEKSGIIKKDVPVIIGRIQVLFDALKNNSTNKTCSYGKGELG